MKILILAGLVLMAIPIQARAQTTEFDYTGAKAGYVSDGGSSPIYNWGVMPFGRETLVTDWQDDFTGEAAQFTITAPTDIATLEASLNYGARTEAGGTGTIDYMLFSGTTNPYNFDGTVGPGIIPLQSSLIERSASITLPGNGQTNVSVPFDATLQPGDYWVAMEGRGDSASSTQEFTTAAVPEPPTWMLMAFSIVLLLAFNYKKLRLA